MRDCLPRSSGGDRHLPAPANLVAAALLCFTGSVAGAAEHHQAPMLEEMVKAGKLPAVEQRLPENPRVVSPVEKVGKYGGTWRSGMVGGSDRNWLFRIAGYEPLLAWDREWTGKVIPNLAEEVTSNPAATEFTVKLRKGLKWSDGKPFGSDDIGFFVNDIVANKELLPNSIDWMVSGGEPGKFEKIDDNTFKITFKEPYGVFPQRLASVYGVQMTMMAKHYCSQFHPAYNKDGIAALAKEAGVQNWTELFIKKCAVDTEANERWQNPDRPTMEPWVIKEPYVGGATLVTLVRNPFYHKVDSAGNQLPYIDDLRISVNADKQTLVLKAVNGEIDYQDRHINANANRPVFLDAASKADIRLVDGPNADMNTTVISLNLTHKDPVKREIFNNKDFRIGLSHAIDRKAIIDSAFVGQGEPWQAAPRKESPYYNERLAKQYTEYDVGKANASLDKAFPKKDSEGFRLGPDGKRITFNIMVIPALGDFLDFHPAGGAILAGGRHRRQGSDGGPHPVLRSQGQQRARRRRLPGQRRHGRCAVRAHLLLPVLERVAVRGAVGQLVCLGRQVRRGAAGRRQEADGPLSRDHQIFRSRQAGRPHEAAARYCCGSVLRHRGQHARTALFGGEEHHAQCLPAAVRLDISEPGRQQYRAILFRYGAMTEG